MSLKAFHIFFILISFGFLAAFGGWAVTRYLATQNMGLLALGIGSWVVGLALGVYGAWFLKKMKENSL